MASMTAARVGAIAGAVAVAGNVAGVLLLGGIPSAYRPDEVAEWTAQTLASPVAASWSGVCFTFGLVALAGWSLVMAARLRTPVGWAGAFFVTSGAILNAAGTLAPVVLVSLVSPACGQTPACEAAGVSLLATSLALDALFNLLFGVGLALFGLASIRTRRGGWVGPVLLVGGVLSVPVSLQIISPMGADLLMVAGPVWLFALAMSSVRLWRDLP